MSQKKQKSIQYNSINSNDHEKTNKHALINNNNKKH